ncbi:MAG: hypothetical protein QOG02_1452 [Gaiellales bacterium]|nr:hypothetical protein [Gaiellales bacterium]
MTHLLRRLGIPAALAVAALAPMDVASGQAPATPKTGMVCTPQNAGGSTYDLWASGGYMQTPDGNSVYMWSYQDAAGDASFQTPGPVLCVTEGQTVSITLHNALPEASSIVFPGQDTEVAATGGTPGLLTTEAASNATATYTFVAGKPGTYLYESGSDVSKQIEMGLYGALIVRPSAHQSWAYNSSSTAFDPSREYLLLLAEIDPDLHHAVEVASNPNAPAYDFTAVHNRYFTINGRSFPDTIQDNDSVLLPSQPYGSLVRIQPNTPGNTQPALIRMINAGVDNHPFHPHGNHTREIAQDGRLLVAPGGATASTEHFAETIGAGQTMDYLLRWDTQSTDSSGQPYNDYWDPNSNPLPVAQPNYRNLTFKDAHTWYSGNPYLGYKGTMPSGTSSLNICGEWYFPLHSHALNEFSNFDQGFGGMGTLLRVDPAGGCFAAATATKILSGTLNAGSYANLAIDDGKLYKVNSTTTGATRVADWYGQFGGLPAGATNLAITYKGSNSSSASQTVYLWDWTTSSWTQLSGPTSVGTSDVTVTPSVISLPANYIGTGTKHGMVRIRVRNSKASTSFVTRGNLMKIVYDAP